MKYETVIFDLDGTLCESATGIIRCVQYALHSIGIEETDLQKLKRFVEPPLDIQFMESYNVDKQTAVYLAHRFRERYKRKGIYECRMYQGVEKMLAHCFQKGIRWAVASGKPEVFVKQTIANAGLDPYFSIVAGSHLQDEINGSGCSKSVIIKRVLHELEQEPHRSTAMVGDRIFDIQGACVHQLMSIGVLYGYGSKEELSQANVIVNNLEELEKELTRSLYLAVFL